MKRTVNILYFPGTNCHRETARAFQQAGATCTILLLDDVLRGRAQLDSADILCLPGGFSFGDHLGAGRIAALCLRFRLREAFDRCQARPLLGICNGWQILVSAGAFGSSVALLPNHDGVFVDHPCQVHTVEATNASPWLRDLQGSNLVFPCAHAEGRFEYGHRSGWDVALRYPKDANPDGSQDGIAGITSENGLTLGLMNHPERTLPDDYCRQLFRNAVDL